MGYADAQLFVDFPNQGILGTLTRLHMTAEYIPHAWRQGSCWRAFPKENRTILRYDATHYHVRSLSGDELDTRGQNESANAATRQHAVAKAMPMSGLRPAGINHNVTNRDDVWHSILAFCRHPTDAFHRRAVRSLLTTRGLTSWFVPDVNRRHRRPARCPPIGRQSAPTHPMHSEIPVPSQPRL